MSAWIVEKAHIDALVHAGILYGIEMRGHGVVKKENATDVGRDLWIENIRSVAYRYPRESFADLPGPGLKPDGYRFEEIEPMSAVALFKAAECYSYQSCETKDYDDTPSGVYIESLIAAIASEQGTTKDLICDTPEYENTPWGLEEEDVRPGKELLTGS